MQMEITLKREGNPGIDRKRNVLIFLCLMLALPWVHAVYVERSWEAMTQKVENAYANEIEQDFISFDPSGNLQNMGLEKMSSTEYSFSRKAFYYLARVEYRLIVRLEKIEGGFDIDVESARVFLWQLF